MVLSFVVNALNLLLFRLLIFDFGMGFDGAPAAITVVNVLQAAVLTWGAPRWVGRLHAEAIAQRGPTWPQWQLRDALRGWGEIIALALPSALMVWSEWWGWELNLFLAGLLCTATGAGGSAAPPVPAVANVANASATEGAMSAAVGNAGGAAGFRSCVVLESFPILSNTMVVGFMLSYGFNIAGSAHVRQSAACTLDVHAGGVPTHTMRRDLLFVRSAKNNVSALAPTSEAGWSLGQVGIAVPRAWT